MDNEHLESTAVLSHAVPDGPVVSSQAAPGGTIRITWQPVTGPSEILPGGSIDITGYQVIVGSFQVTVPASATGVTVPAESYQSLPPGSHAFEVLAIDASGNQTITEGFFVKSS